MSLFQHSVITKYSKNLDQDKVNSAYEKYKKHFLNPEIQQNIRDSKEEQYQGEFLIDLFVNVLGFTKSPTPNYNLTTEYKNFKDSKKADGAIIINDVVKAVIELKGTNTTDLSKIEVQAFGYKNNQPACIYVITSNFEKLRFYIDNAIEFIEFNLFTLNRKDFELLFLCLAFENIEKEIPKKIKDESVSQEDIITKKLYQDYSLFKRELHQNLVTQNPQFDALTLFKKSQKLLDRFLFLFFAEDRQLLPPNSVRLILNDWKDLQERDVIIPLYDRFKKYFEYLNTGFKGKRYDVFAYNGGLFKPDEILDAINIDDDLLYKHTFKLSEYDFVSEIDVNILGHIFENSLNELDEIKAQFEGHEIDKTKTRRKKDGIFYTPKYITKYIIENTVGKLCDEKKNELQIVEEEYITDKKRQKKTIQTLLEKLTNYRNWLLKLTICDPACGSGAFLNQALDFLIMEHRYIDELQAKLFGDSLILSDIEKSILENNLFGVDINEESVEIAKLSLWLRTAQPNRKLNDLNNNIKCGNSLIDDPEIAGEKAFNWHSEFPQVFEKGGFDVVIGNPPYVRNELISNQDKVFLEKNYKTFTGKSDLYVFFFERSCNILKDKGKNGFIVSSKYTKTKYGKILIDFLQNTTHIISFIDFKDLDVFDGIVAYPSIIIFDNNQIDNNLAMSNMLVVSNDNYYEIDNLFANSIEVVQSELFEKLGSWSIGVSSNGLFQIIKKITLNNTKIQNIELKPQVGIKTGLNSVFIFNSNEIPVNIYQSNLLKDYVTGREVKRYSFINPKNKIIFPYRVKIDTNKLQLIEDLTNYSIENEYLLNFYNQLSNRAIIDEGIDKGTKKWYEFQQIKLDFPYNEEYIIYPDISSDVNFTIANNKLMDMTCFGIPSNSKSLLGILNSRLIRCYLESVCAKARGGYLRLKNQYILNIPIPEIFEQEEIESKVLEILSLNKELQENSQKFQRTIQRKFALVDLPNKLQNWYLLSYPEFISELSKKKVKLSLSEEAEWESYFLQESKKALELKTKIEKTDKEIDKMVYELYELTEEEIRIVEESV